MPLVSVIIPAYNRAHTLNRALDSVFAQRFDDFETLVVDDGSTDETPALLKKYPQVRVITLKGPRGVGAARNAGVDAAKASLIAFLDSDDQWLPEKLAVQTAFFRQNPGVHICQTEELWVRSGRRINPKRRHEKPQGAAFFPSLNLCLVSPSAVMMRKTLFKSAGGFDETLYACEDYALWLTIANRHPVYLIKKPLIIKHGGHHDQLSALPGLDRYRIHALYKLLMGVTLSPRKKKRVIQTLRQKVRVYAAGCERRGRHEEAGRYLSLLKLSP